MGWTESLLLLRAWIGFGLGGITLRSMLDYLIYEKLPSLK